mmetsp:Transcript_30527/g.86316  ORF Transcript_30527/g.86316 Transcript_30527/m.86316 type:complete len:272 (+) Transcript_30527:278-1093(+)
MKELKADGQHKHEHHHKNHHHHEALAVVGLLQHLGDPLLRGPEPAVGDLNLLIKVIQQTILEVQLLVDCQCNVLGVCDSGRQQIQLLILLVHDLMLQLHNPAVVELRGALRLLGRRRRRAACLLHQRLPLCLVPAQHAGHLVFPGPQDGDEVLAPVPLVLRDVGTFRRVQEVLEPINLCAKDPELPSRRCRHAGCLRTAGSVEAVSLLNAGHNFICELLCILEILDPWVYIHSQPGRHCGDKALWPSDLVFGSRPQTFGSGVVHPMQAAER